MTWKSLKNGTYLIAEIGGNHEGNMEYAKNLVQLAISSGVDAVKLQIYSGDTLVSSVEDPDRYIHFNRFQLKKDEYIQLAQMCLSQGVVFTSSIWDVEAIEWIDPLLEFYKIGSGDLTAYPILKRIAMTGKPIILSTGLATLDEVKESLAYLQKHNTKYKLADSLALLQCSSMYPILESEANLCVMDTYRKEFGVTVGYSDHTIGSEAIEIAVAMGAEVIEFHFTDSCEGKSFRDHKISLTHDEVLKLRERICLIRNYRGINCKTPVKSEIESQHIKTFRRAVYLKRDVCAGETIKEEDIIVLRPNSGIDARDYERVIGKRLLVDHKALQALQWKDLE